MHTQDALSSLRLPARLGRWLLPWACVLLLAVGIAHAANDALVRTLPEPAAQPVLAEPRPTATHGVRWLQIESIDTDGSHVGLACLSRLDDVASDVLVVPIAKWEQVIDELCSEIRR